MVYRDPRKYYRIRKHEKGVVMSVLRPSNVPPIPGEIVRRFKFERDTKKGTISIGPKFDPTTDTQPGTGCVTIVAVEKKGSTDIVCGVTVYLNKASQNEPYIRKGINVARQRLLRNMDRGIGFNVPTLLIGNVEVPVFEEIPLDMSKAFDERRAWWAANAQKNSSGVI